MKKMLSVALAAVLLTGCYNEDDSANYIAADMDQQSTTEMAATSQTANEFTTTVYFDFDNDKLTASASEVLDRHAQYLAANATATIVLEGHADSKGTQAYNLGLSQRRARTIATYLLAQGVSQDQLTEVSFGKEKLVSNQDELNRRVEIVYQG